MFFSNSDSFFFIDKSHSMAQSMINPQKRFKSGKKMFKYKKKIDTKGYIKRQAKTSTNKKKVKYDKSFKKSSALTLALQ